MFNSPLSAFYLLRGEAGQVGMVRGRAGLNGRRGRTHTSSAARHEGFAREAGQVGMFTFTGRAGLKGRRRKGHFYGMYHSEQSLRIPSHCFIESQAQS